jgi:hypothetical protein
MAIRLLAFMMLAGAAWACQARPPEKPQQPLDPQNARSLAEHAIYNTRTLSYQTKFKARLAAPQGDPIDYQGTSLRHPQGVLYIHYTATGGDLKNIVNAGESKIWVWHEGAGEWVTPEEIGSPGIGRGIQNPDEILDTLSRHLEGARLLSPGVVEVSFAGEALQKIMKDQARLDAFDWKESKASIELHTDDQIRLKKLVCRAELKSTDPNIKGWVKYTGDIEAETYAPEKEMKFLDEDKKPIPLNAEIRKAVDTAMKEKK